MMEITACAGIFLIFISLVAISCLAFFLGGFGFDPDKCHLPKKIKPEMYKKTKTIKRIQTYALAASVLLGVGLAVKYVDVVPCGQEDSIARYLKNMTAGTALAVLPMPCDNCNEYE